MGARTDALRRELGTTDGVLDPVGWVVVSFPSGEQLDQAVGALAQAGLGELRMHRLTPEEMLEETTVDLEQAGTLARIGQQFNLARAQNDLARQGHHFMFVHAPSNEQAQAVADAVRGCGAERAQSYGRFIIEELIQHPGDEAQVGESPARGLDAQTPSGEEAERPERHGEGGEGERR